MDPSGPLATLRKLLLSEESIATFKKWVQHHWYTVALAAVGVFLLLVCEGNKKLVLSKGQFLPSKILICSNSSSLDGKNCCFWTLKLILMIPLQGAGR